LFIPHPPPRTAAHHSSPTRRSSDLGGRRIALLLRREPALEFRLAPVPLLAHPVAQRAPGERGRPVEPAHHVEHRGPERGIAAVRSEEHTSELQSREKLVCRLLLEKK